MLGRRVRLSVGVHPQAVWTVRGDVRYLGFEGEVGPLCQRMGMSVLLVRKVGKGLAWRLQTLKDRLVFGLSGVAELLEILHLKFQLNSR